MNRQKTFKQIARKCGWKNYHHALHYSAIGIQTNSGWYYCEFEHDIHSGLNDLTSEDIQTCIDYVDDNLSRLCLQDGFTLNDLAFVKQKLEQLYWALRDKEQAINQEWVERQKQLKV